MIRNRAPYFNREKGNLKQMKKVLTGGFLSLLGTLWAIGLLFFISNNLVLCWDTPPGCFWTTVAEYKMGLPLFAAFLLFALGLVLMGNEYFKKEA